ncbi:MAG: ABC transporter permease [Elusimicrobia bacterium CG_4_9_14_3_um_filter_62_55]|nr:MAG: ABC transporter permease [Elusimicrobia bacterium CG22_combo_CG10-13_8_21_14_all_63_91]PJA11952.1 MAG: ABC transporter permease [Elusimicrobia bacterium CG_4_10_14_0_2_um_filter_63_34]PJB23803.1 MAG: ABC transporter permease [Elusimicrobia bacterium CG_4_9_14_3_um_filter_62_55]
MNLAKKFLPYLKPYRLRFYQAAMAMILVALSNGATVLLIRFVVNGLFKGEDLTGSQLDVVISQIAGPLLDKTISYRTLWLITISVPLLIAVKSGAAYAQNYLMSWLGQRITQEMREDLFRHLHRLSLEFYSAQRAGEVLARVTNDLTLVQSMLQFVPLYLIRDLLTIIVLMTSLFFLNWRFALVALAIIPIASAVIIPLGRKMRDSSSKSQAIMGDIYHRFQESLHGMMLIKALNYEEGAIRKFQAENQSFFVQMMRYLRATALSGPLMEFLGSIIMASLVFFGGREIALGRMDAGSFGAFLTAFFSAYAPVKNLGKLNSELQRGLASGERIFQLLEERPNIIDRPGARKFTGLETAVRLDQVLFQYPSRETPALDRVSFEVRRGETVAIVGPSGSGKSTLVQLLLRLYDPSAGALFFDADDLRDLDIRTVRERIGLVTQETMLFNETVLGNIAIGREDSPLEAVVEAARVANADEFIRQLPKGYQTPLGDRGLRLSGGQRQRLAIARAVLRDPEILILDEATSNLDSTSEKEVQRALETVMSGRTSIVIAHRLSTIQNADRIVVLNSGRVEETGSHAELLAANGIYKKLYALQVAIPDGDPV